MSKILLIGICAGLITVGRAQSLQLIPKPAEVTFLDPDSFKLDKNTCFYFVNGKISNNVTEFNDLLNKYYGFKLGWLKEPGDTVKPYIKLEISANNIIPSEGYELTVRRKRIVITASDQHGLFYGLVSLLQLMEPGNKENYYVPSIKIVDFPRFKWRGMHLDVCRHFFPVAFIKKYIDILALHKINTFHWHLTEDQGWRIEIKKYPKLTQIGGWRNGSMIGHYRDHKFDTLRYGGFYTQDEISEVVAYARKRHVTIVPEIELPGHALAALASYPEFSCTGGPFEVGKQWGVYDDVYCAGNEATFEFIEDILTEVCNLFPGEYIHIGGDECPKVRWSNCPKCQKRIANEGLKDENELQSYFIKRVETFLNSKGKKIIGWDEILEGGLAPNAAVMSWRGEQGGIAAANQGHEVVMCPGSHCYFDHYQGRPNLEPIAIGGFTPVEKVYNYDPVPKDLDPAKSKYIIGAQGNVWTEYILNESHVEYMAVPRMSALSEVLWTQPQLKDEDDFFKRLEKHFNLLDTWGINYSKSLYQVGFNVRRCGKYVCVDLIPGPTGEQIAYKLYGINFPIPESYTITRAGHPTVCQPSISSKIIAKQKGKSQVSEMTLYLSKSTAKTISFTIPPSKYYNYESDFTLVNGVKANLPRNNHQWNAWQGKDVELVIDLEGKFKISEVEIGYLKDLPNWIVLPSTISVLISSNGKKFREVIQIDSNTINDNPRQLLTKFKSRKARWVKIILTNPGQIPVGGSGTMEDSWLFLDEIQIN